MLPLWTKLKESLFIKYWNKIIHVKWSLRIVLRVSCYYVVFDVVRAIVSRCPTMTQYATVFFEHLFYLYYTWC